jgi:Peptidase family C25
MKFFSYSCLFLLMLIIFGCDSEGTDNQTNNLNNTNNGNNNDGGIDIIENPWNLPDPQGRITENNLINDGDPVMLIITNEVQFKTWEKYSTIKNVQGLNTKVEKIENIISSNQGSDNAEKLRNYLINQYNTFNIKFVLLGGDAHDLPFRRVENYIMATEEFTSNGPSQLYYSNLSLNWDLDDDGIYGEKDEDFSLEDSRTTQIAVGRIPTSNIGEIENYINKYLVYQSDHERFEYPLLLSDIAGTFIVDIDAAEGVEVTFEDYFPVNYKNNVRKLYETEGAATQYGGQVKTPELLKEALNAGYSLVYHNGHGSHNYMTSMIDRDLVNSFVNPLPTAFVSCSCMSANFADKAYGSHYTEWEVQGVNEDSAGELFITNPAGGVLYVGNTAVGLGPIGGSQFLHAFFAGIFQEDITYAGEAFNYARIHTRNSGWSIGGLLPSTMTDDSEWWTQHVVYLMGDPSLRFWVSNPEKLIIEAPQTYSYGFNSLTITVKNAANSPVAGMKVFLGKPGDFKLEGLTDSNGEVVFEFVPVGAENLYVGLDSLDYKYKVTQITPIIE